MSEVADGPDTNVSGRCSRPRSAANASGTVSTIWSVRTTQMWTSGTSVSARLPSISPPERMSVPVSAIPTVHPVMTPSRASSSCVLKPSSSTELGGRHVSGRPRGTPKRPSRASSPSRSHKAAAVVRSTRARYSRRRSLRSATRPASSRTPVVRYARATRSGGAPSLIAARVRARISSRASLTAPPLPEGLLRKRLQVASLRPRGERTRHTTDRSLTSARELLRPFVKPCVPEDTSERAHCDPLRDILLRLRSQMQEHARNVDLHGADLVAGAAQARCVRQRLGICDTAKLRREDRADRAGVNRAIGVAARPRIHRADVQARTTANAVERLPAHLVGEHARPSVVQQDHVELLRSVTDRHTGPERRVRVHPLARRGPRQNLEEDLKVGERRDKLLDPKHRHEHRRQCRAHPPVAFRLDDDDRPGLRDTEVRTADSHLCLEELLAQVKSRRFRKLARIVRKLSPVRNRAHEQIADLGAIPMNRRDEDVRRPIAVELQNQLGKVGLARTYSAGGERFVETYLICRQRFHLDDLGRAVRTGDIEQDRVRLACVACPVDLAARGLYRFFELEQILVEPPHDVFLDRAARVPQLLPVGHLGDNARALVANRGRRVAQIVAQLAVAESDPCGLGKRRHEASISARRIERIPVPCRERPPPICIRHDPSTAVTTSAPVSITHRHLSSSIAVEVSAFLTANVPPKPQHSAASGSSTSSRPRTPRSSRSGAAPTCNTRSEWQVGW